MSAKILTDGWLVSTDPKSCHFSVAGAAAARRPGVGLLVRGGGHEAGQHLPRGARQLGGRRVRRAAARGRRGGAAGAAVQPQYSQLSR